MAGGRVGGEGWAGGRVDWGRGVDGQKSGWN